MKMSSEGSGSTDARDNMNDDWEDNGEKNRTIGVTEVGKEEYFDFCWVIKDFSLLPNKEVESPIFCGGHISLHKWCLVLTPRRKKGIKEYISIFLKLKDIGDQMQETENKVSAKFDMLLYLNGTKIKMTTNHEFILNDIKDDWGWSDFKEVPENIQNDTIKFQCKIWINNRKPTGTIIKKLVSDEPAVKNYAKLHSDLDTLYKAKLNSDIEIIVEGHSFKAHKAMLSARSSVFSRMFATRMKESENSTVEIQDFDKDVVEQMIEYIYTGGTTITDENVQFLFQIAEKYDLTDMKSECEAQLIKSLKIPNAISLLELADKLNAPLLKSNAMDIIIRNKKKVVKTKNFKQMLRTNKVLIADIFMAEISNF